MKNPVNAIVGAAGFAAVPTWLCMAEPPIWITALALIWAGCLVMWVLCIFLYIVAPARVKVGMEKYLKKRIEKELGI